MQNWYKNVFVDATVLFWTSLNADLNFLSNRSYMGFEPELLISLVRLCTPWATEQTYRLRKPIDMKLETKLYIFVKNRNKMHQSFTASSVHLFWKLRWYILIKKVHPGA